jgi:hypothetical protein
VDLARHLHVGGEPVRTSYNGKIPGDPYGDFLGIKVVRESRHLLHEIRVKAPDRRCTDKGWHIWQVSLASGA